MIKVLIVDDEKLVRKGIVNIVDWSKHNMIVVGEVENGRSAMNFLQDNQVDLLFTDWSMPGLSGIEFLEQVKNQYPHMHIVVLTMHQEFLYIQQAMRLGITDYITKSQIERENVDTIIENISLKLNKNMNFESYEDNYQKINLFENGVILYSSSIDDKKLINITNQWGLNKIYKLDENLWYVQGKKADYIRSTSDLIVIKVIGKIKPSYKDVIKQLHSFIDDDLFYLYQKDKACYSLDIDKTSVVFINKALEKSCIINDFKNLLWVTDNTDFQKILKRISDLRLSKEKLSVFCYQLYVQWSTLNGKDIANYFIEISDFNWWTDWKKWFYENREILKQKVSPYCEDADHTLMMLKVLEYIQKNYNEEISLDDMLRFTNMSKSNFCRCFKKLTNTTFLNYLKAYRVEKAKDYLMNTTQPIYWVAEKVGYKNEKYFKCVFQEITGKSPKKFRNC